MKLKTMKRLKQGVVALIVLAMSVVYVPELTFAGDGDSNDTYLTADTIYANSMVTDSVSTTDQIDYYKYTVAQAGYFTVQLNRLGSSGSLTTQINDGNNSKLESSYKSSFESRTYDFGVGESIYIMVKRSSGPKTIDYTLTVNATVASDWEQEYNDDSSMATVLSNGQWINGNKYKSGDADWYQYTIRQNGYLQFEVERVNTASGDIYIYDDNVQQLERGSLSNSLTSKKYCGEIGKTFYVKVNPNFVGNQYHIRAVFTASDEWENEDNNTLENANTLVANQTVHGSLSSKSDSDFYRFDSTGKGNYHFTFTNVDANSSAHWKLTLYDSNKNLIQSVKTGSEMETELRTLNFQKGAATYLKVEQYSSSSTYGTEYAVTLNFEDDSNWETEPNNSFAKATTLKKGVTKTGNIYSGSDEDYYVYTTTKAGTIRFTFTGSSVDVGNGWNVYLYNKNKKELKKVTYLKNSTKIAVKTKKGQKYYLVVKPASTYSEAKMLGVSYEVKVN